MSRPNFHTQTQTTKKKHLCKNTKNKKRTNSQTQTHTRNTCGIQITWLTELLWSGRHLFYSFFLSSFYWQHFFLLLIIIIINFVFPFCHHHVALSPLPPPPPQLPSLPPPLLSPPPPPSPLLSSHPPPQPTTVIGALLHISYISHTIFYHIFICSAHKNETYQLIRCVCVCVCVRMYGLFLLFSCALCVSIHSFVRSRSFQFLRL